MKLHAEGKDESKTGFTDDELAGLSEAERAALEADDDDEDALRAIAGADEDDEDEAAKAAREKAEAEAAAAAKAKEDATAKLAEEVEAKKRVAELAKMSAEDRAKAEAEDRAKVEAAVALKAKADAQAKAEADAKARPESDEDEPFMPFYKAEPPEKYDEKMKELDARRDAATAKFKANEIEVDEMLAEYATVEGERRELDEKRVKAEISAEQAEQQADQRWMWEINRFMKNVLKHEAIDYKAAPGLHAALDAEVKALAADKNNEGWTGDQFLEAAHNRIKTQFKIGKPVGTVVLDDAAKAKAKADADANAKAESERKRRANENRDKLHKSLGGLPAAGAAEISGQDGEFAALENLSGMELETAVARLTPEQQDRWARQ